MDIAKKNLRISYYLALPILMVIMLLLNFRNFGLYPIVFADEWLYSTYSRLLPMIDSPRPMYLFYWIYGSTKLCGDSFLTCARLINSIVFIAAFPFIYYVSRLYMGKKLAIYISICSLLLPINIYTAYFMPESLQFLLFWIFIYTLLNYSPSDYIYKAIGSGLSLGLMSLVKPHALFLIPIVWLFFYLNTNRNEFRKTIYLILINLIVCLFTKMFLGYLFVGTQGLTFFGSDYSGVARSIDLEELFFKILPLSLINLYGHIVSIIIIFGVPLTCIYSNLVFKGSIDSKIKDDSLVIFSKILLLLLVVLIGISSIFAGKAAGMGQYESIGRLSLRYYDFTFPLLLILVAASYSKYKNNNNLNIISLTFILLIVYVSFDKMHGYLPNLVDSPVLRSYMANNIFFIALSLVALLSLLSAIFNRGFNYIIYIFVYIPLLIILTNSSIVLDVSNSMKPSLYDQSCQFANRYLGDNARKLSIIGPDLANLFRCSFYMSVPGANIFTVENNQIINGELFPKDTEWLLLFGDYKFDLDYISKLSIPVIEGDGVKLGEFTLLNIAYPASLHIKPTLNTSHTTGHYSGKSGGVMVATGGETGALIFGPYKRLAPGKYKARYLLSAESDDVLESLGNVDVSAYNDTSKFDKALVSKSINASAVEQSIEVFFDVDDKDLVYQFRVWVNGLGKIVTLNSIDVERISSSP